MPRTLVPRIAAVAAAAVLAAACQDGPVQPSADEVQFSSAGAALAHGLPGPVWGGLNSSRDLLEQFVRWDVDGAEIWVDNYPWGFVDLRYGTISSVTFDFSGYRLDHTFIRFSIAAEAPYEFRCWPAADPEPTTATGTMPVIVTGFIDPNDEMPAIRNAVQFRAWLASTLYRTAVWRTHFVYVEYDSNCEPTQVFP